MGRSDFRASQEVVCRGTASTALRGPTGPVYPRGADTAQAAFVICDESIEQDHRFVKHRVHQGLGVGTFTTARRTIQGYEAMYRLRKGQLDGVAKSDILA